MLHRMSKVLVAYSTLSGCTTTIAKRIGCDFIAYGVRPQVVSVEEMPMIPADIDAVVFGSGVRMGKFHKEARDWLTANAEFLDKHPLALFSVGLRAASPQTEGLAERDLDTVMHETAHGLHPKASVVFPGWKRSEGFTSMEKLALRVYPLAEGDYRDWDKVDAWVRSTAPLMFNHGPLVKLIPMRKY